jgi:AraC-like DNA-binding protein
MRLVSPPSPPADRKGILEPALAAASFRLSRHAPSAHLTAVVDWYWIVSWNLPRGVTHTQNILAHPCVNAVLERGQSGIFGPERGLSSKRLEGTGRAFGVKFKPAGFTALSCRNAAALVGQSESWLEGLGIASSRLECEVLSLSDELQMVRRVETALGSRPYAPNSSAEVVNGAVALIAAHPEVTRVAQLAATLSTSPRQLERLFRQYIGLSPKWVIRQHRLFEAAARLAENPAASSSSWADLALELGYFDQAHFNRDFRAVVGESPAGYADRCAAQNAAEK